MSDPTLDPTVDPTQTQNATSTPAAGAQGGSATPDNPLDNNDDGQNLTKSMQERLARQKSQYEKQLAEKETRLRELEEAEEVRKREQMTEAERIKADLEAERNRAAQLEVELSASQIKSLRSEIIASDIATLPAAYKALVTGTDEASIKESAANAKAAFEADREAILEGTAASIGAAPPANTSNAADNPPATWAEGNRSTSEWRKERERRGIGKAPII